MPTGFVRVFSVLSSKMSSSGLFFWHFLLAISFVDFKWLSQTAVSIGPANWQIPLLIFPGHSIGGSSGNLPGLVVPPFGRPIGPIASPVQAPS
jgi:hypothetical protein